MPGNRERGQDDIASNPPLWAMFAIDRKSAQLIADAADRSREDTADVGYATASDLPNHLRRAALLARFLESKPSGQEIILQTANLFNETMEQTDETFSQADIRRS